MTNQVTVTLELPSEREIVITCSFAAPRSLVFEAWTKPEHLANWWGPRGFTIPEYEMDLRPGGAYRYVMQGPDGSRYPSKGEYREIVPPERLVYTDAFDIKGMPSHESVVTVTFAEQDGGTFLTAHTLYNSAESRDAVLEMGVEAGITETLERLAEYLTQM
jgi:uncharacterized protein YndB with AHSA1/START domain